LILQYGIKNKRNDMVQAYIDWAEAFIAMHPQAPIINGLISGYTYLERPKAVEKYNRLLLKLYASKKEWLVPANIE
jgi:hypothetical protein